MTSAVLLLLLLSAGDCERCHARVAADFAQSRHSKARTLPVFALSFPHAKTPWCLSCHQPESSGSGHSCLTCHRAAGNAVRNSAASDAGVHAHPVLVESEFGVEVCARCHEFRTPLPDHLWPVVMSDEPLQSTVSEQRASMPGARCVTCHDPHRALGAHDVTMLKKALTARATFIDGGVEVELQVGRTGHRLPTGDPFRRLVVMTCADRACSEVVGRRTFSRSLGAPDGGAWITVRDTTLASNQRTVVRLPPARWWSVRYFFGDPRFEPQLPEDEVALLLESGELPLSPRGEGWGEGPNALETR